MREMLISKLFRTDWKGWNSELLGSVGVITLLAIGGGASLFYYPFNTRILNSFFTIGFALSVTIPGMIALAIVDEFLLE